MIQEFDQFRRATAAFVLVAGLEGEGQNTKLTRARKEDAPEELIRGVDEPVKSKEQTAADAQQGANPMVRNGSRSEYYNSTASRIGEIQQQRADLYQRRLGNREIAEMVKTPRVLVRGASGAVHDLGDLLRGINRPGL